MNIICFFLFTFFLGTISGKEEGPPLPKLYEYFGNVTEGLVAKSREGFRLNGRLIRLISGAIHYFRVHPSLWSDRLRKLRASGANTVETYVPWNLHEPVKGVWDFGEKDLVDHDMSLFLDIRKFLQVAQEEDLLVILRPGPYICSEFEFGGMPSYLLRDPLMRVRTAYPPYLERVKLYFDQLLPLVKDLQFTKGGPIIAVQVENEYASFDTIEKEYLEFVQGLLVSHGLDESLLFTSDGSYNGDKGSLPGLLKTANFQSNPESNLNDLLKFQPDKPPMVMEYWAGWFDHWFESHSTTSPTDFKQALEVIFGKYNASVNFYMFHGGTNFGFTAGANIQGSPKYYAPDVTSYDYDAPVSEHGTYTPKYSIVQELSLKYALPPLWRPVAPPLKTPTSFPPLRLEKYLTLPDLLEQSVPMFKAQKKMSMEALPMNNGGGQSQGYILYRKEVTGSHVFRAGPVRDFATLLVDGVLQPFPKNKSTGATSYWLQSVQEYNISGTHTIDLLVENMGRVNFGAAENFLQHKGLTDLDTYALDGVEIQDLQIYALEFKSKWVQSLNNWRLVNNGPLKAPILVQSSFVIGSEDEIQDTFLDMGGWGKGIVFINGFNLGRYFTAAGPQVTLYLPAPFLRVGQNTVTIFEQLAPGSKIVFSSKPNLGRVNGQSKSHSGGAGSEASDNLYQDFVPEEMRQF